MLTSWGGYRINDGGELWFEAVKSEWPSHIERCPVPIYGGHLAYVDKKRDYAACIAAAQTLHEPLHKSDWGASDVLETQGGALIYLIGVFKGGNAVLIHELDHVAFKVLKWSGVPVSKGGANEAHAYLLDALYTQVKDQQRKRRQRLATGKP